MKICEMFYSLQGEGYYTGVPSVFIRTSGCNLKCTYCDTPFAVYKPEGDKISTSQIIDNMYKEWGWVEHVVISGGEPMVQSDLSELVNTLIDSNHIVTIETNGTIYNNDIIPSLFSISPKTQNSYPDKESDWYKIHNQNNDLSALAKIIHTGIPYQMKFVVAFDSDLEEIDNIITMYNVDRKCVYLMPQGTSKEQLSRTAPMVAEICKLKRYIYCPRVHVDLWGDTRGV